MDDGDKEESDSIGNQRNLLDYYIRQIFKGRNVEVIEIVDDGQEAHHQAASGEYRNNGDKDVLNKCNDFISK